MRLRRGRVAAAALCLTLIGCASRQAPTTAVSPAPAPAPTADGQLATAFDARFAAAAAVALWAVHLERLDARVLVSRNPDRLVLPSSNMKIVTLAAAGTRLGAALSPVHT